MPGRKNADDAMLLELASGKTVQAVAELCDVSERTVRRRQADPDFRQRLHTLRAEMIERGLGKLADGVADAAQALRNLLAEGKSESVKLAAAKVILEQAVKLREAAELEERIRALEERLNKRE
jgi:hypothetical protein